MRQHTVGRAVVDARCPVCMLFGREPQDLLESRPTDRDVDAEPLGAVEVCLDSLVVASDERHEGLFALPRPGPGRSRRTSPQATCGAPAASLAVTTVTLGRLLVNSMIFASVTGEILPRGGVRVRWKSVV